MSKQFALGVLSSAFFAGAVLAQPPAPRPPERSAPAILVQSSEECMKRAFDLAETAEAKIAAEDKLDQIEDLLTRMEMHCDAKQWNEAMAVADEIQKVIESE